MAAEIKAAAVKTVEATQTALLKTAEATQVAFAKPAAKVAASGYTVKAKAFLLAHSVGFALTGGIIIGIGAYYLANKLWGNRDRTAEAGVSE